MKPLLMALLFAAGTAAAKDNPLVGSWLLEGQPYAEFRADGSGVVNQQTVMWKAQKGMLGLLYASGAQELMAYSLSGGKLTVTMGGATRTFTRASAKAAAKAAPKPEAKPAKGSAATDSLSKLLLSSAWCSFTYNKISGASHTERVVFRPNGTWSSGARGETYSSGAYGTYAGQSDSGSGGRWQVSGGALWMSEGVGALADVGLGVTRNSNGYPILKSEGKEYSQCR